MISTTPTVAVRTMRQTISAGPEALVDHPWRADRRWLAPLLILFLVRELLLVAIVAPFTGHDEVDHFYYLARLAEGGGLGVVGEVLLPPAARPYENYVSDYPYNAEVIQPPLYHLLLTPLYVAVPGGALSKLYMLRLVSVAIGLMVVWLAYLTARLLFSNDALVRIGVPVFVALQPQFSYVSAIVNHDIFLILLFSTVFYLVLRGLRDGFGVGLTRQIGIVAAAGLWTKASFGLVLPVIAVGVVLRWRQDRDTARALCRRLLTAVALPLVVALPWFIRSYRLYGDPTGAERLRSLAGSDQTASSYWAMVSSLPFWQDRLQDFWGNYGWRRIPFDPLTYQIVWLVWAVAGAGLIILAVRWLTARRFRPGPILSGLQIQALGLTIMSLLLLVYGVLYVGTIQFTQSRFAFPGMIGFGLLTMVGLGQWVPARARPVLVPLVAVALIALNTLVAIRFVLPYYYGPGGSSVGQ